MPSRLSCWLNGHKWGPWEGGWQNIFGVRFKVRWCEQCSARDQRAAKYGGEAG